ncbi:MAG: hypothetical protein ACI8S6_005589, partial [Myxococcota bacterium]
MTTTESSEKGWRRHWPLMLLLAVTALSYARLWSVGWSWDDEALILDNQVTGSLWNIGQFFTHDLWGTTQLSELKSGYYRPLMLLTLAVDRAIFPEISSQAGATLSHIHSLVWHLGAVAALYAVLVRMFVPVTAATGALLLALHPLNAEVLALVAARNDSMAALFTLAAMWMVMDRTARPGRLLGAGLLFLAGLLSKESAILGPVMLLTLDLARWRRPGDLIRYLPFVLSAGVYFALRSLADINQGISLSAGIGHLQDNLLGLVALYGKLLVWPWPLTPARHISYLPPASENLLGLVLCLGLLGAAITRGKQRALVVAGLVWAGLAFAPSLAATLDKGLLGERYLYFSMAGLGLMLVAAVPQPPRWLVPALAIPAILALQLRLPQWQNSRTVWEAAHAASPSPFTAAGLAWYYHRDGDLDKANPLLVYALEGEPPYRDVCDLIVMSHLQAKQTEEAARLAAWAVRERGCPPRGMIIDHWAVALAGMGQWSEAVQVAMQQPGGPAGPGRVVVAAAQARTGQIDAVRQQAAASGDPQYLARVARMLRLGGEPEAAEA